MDWYLGSQARVAACLLSLYVVSRSSAMMAALIAAAAKGNEGADTLKIMPCIINKLIIQAHQRRNQNATE